MRIKLHKLQKLFCLLLVGIMLAYPASAASSFPDVEENAEYVEAVEYVNAMEIMVGDENGNFNPDKTVTRAEMATIVCRMVGETENLSPSLVFSDVPGNHWANKYIGKAVELGIIIGYGNGKYGPSDNLTYEQTVAMIIRALGGTGMADELGGYPNGFISIAEEYGFLEGTTFEIGHPIPRADVAVILYNSGGFYFDVDTDEIQDGAQLP